MQGQDTKTVKREVGEPEEGFVLQDEGTKALLVQ